MSPLKSVAACLLFLSSGSLAALAGSPQACSSTVQSCKNTTAQTNTCCFNAPGGQLLQTQFWDTDPETGPTNSWTIHGLWPDNCDGSYQSSCDSSRAYTGINTILKNFGMNDVLTYMNTYWKNQGDTDESLWEHEWAKHGTCISTLEPSCYTGYTKGEEAADFFNRTVALFKTLPTYTWLSNAGITPSNSKTYTSSAIIAALKSAFGATPVIQCSGSELDQVYYGFETKGSVQTGTFVPVAIVGESSNCPSSGIKYLVKSSSNSRRHEPRALGRYEPRKLKIGNTVTEE